MADNDFHSKVINATKWSTITQIVAKIISPLTNMILARILVPEAFGVVATITMITSFVEMFTDAGFQKYLIQHEFKTENEKYKSANVAFLTNLTLSFILWGIIILSSEKIAIWVGNPGLGNVIAIACLQLPISAFSSIQMALYRRAFDFKTLFIVRMVAIFIPFVVTIPLALLGLNYWSLIIGNIALQLLNAIVLTIKSDWKPSLEYSVSTLKEMLSFSIWSLIEAISIWLTTWVDAFIIASALSEYYLGIYKTSTTMVNALMALITASIVPVLFATLSRLQNDTEAFNQTYLKMQKVVAIFVLPIGIGVFLYSDLATSILLGNQWEEASKVIGIWALTSSIMIVLGHFCSEVYRAKGKPKLSFLAQLLHLIVLVPVCLISSKYGFLVLVYARSLIRLQFVLVHFIIMKFAIGISTMRTIKNIVSVMLSAIIMGGIGYLLQQFNSSLIWDFISIILCMAFYFAMLCFFSNTRKEVVGILSKFKLR
ncbi:MULTISPECIES: lipopolysaccharide biosynthesis protein [Bacillus]|uniref:lipopolysaccharide biosynthesis protein n=1 Tax=Bacillus TaxID=1386 RepID=UPI00122F0F5F|nr:lipopolysaccharide biosynthesis protein [Bacillus cereus]KAA2398115.1 lipopolysaccharide biosynthesis protein [Bacillus cereus]MDH8002806.1 lipopolysaccharide biosynthesis protein [Bacillus cereus]NKW86039.1 lipopolysaccharide biosynthesis protein [Bacillus cereus]